MRDIFYILVILLLVFSPKKKIVEVDIIKINEHVDSINYGGCGVFAYNLYARLDPNRYSIKSIDNHRHIMIYDEVNDVYLDSRGWFDPLQMYLNLEPKVISSITPDSLLTLINTDSIWNPAYDRRQDSIIIAYVNSL